MERQKFVGGGSEGARLPSYEPEGMLVSLNERQKTALYTSYCMGERVDDLARSYGIGESTAYKYIKQARDAAERSRKEAEGMSAREKIVCGDKASGRLVSLNDPCKFEGTCVVGGKTKKKTFTAAGVRMARTQYERWCKELRDEQEFMDMVERKPKEGTAVCGAPSDPIEEIRPIEPEPEPETEPEPEPAPVTAGTVYVLVTTEPALRAYRWYGSMEAAMAEMDRMNEVLEFVGSERTVDILEVEGG